MNVKFDTNVLDEPVTILKRYLVWVLARAPPIWTEVLVAFGKATVAEWARWPTPHSEKQVECMELYFSASYTLS